MSTITEYGSVKAYSLYDLKKYVNEAIHNGWQPLGEPVWVRTGAMSCDADHWVQAIVRREER